MDDAAIRAAIPGALERYEFQGHTTTHGKVRDMVRLGDRRVIVTSDRVSAFDRVLGTIPLKGQVLNQLSAWWFQRLSHILDAHHMLEVPDPNAMLVANVEVLPVEVVVRGHITGSTSTSLWTLYEAGVDKPYGLDLPKGLQKHARLATPVITPTTKAEAGEHDERLTSEDVVSRGLVHPRLWKHVQRTALATFAAGQKIADAAGYVLADTKYEFGLLDGELCLIDEVHTMDSSRYWERAAWEKAMAEGGSPPSLSKERLRLWLKTQGYSGDGPSPPLPDDVKVDVARTYITAFERLTGTTFVPGAQPVGARIHHNLRPFMGG